VDNGPGVGDSARVHEGIGLRNTRARLHHLYGPTPRCNSAPRAGKPPRAAHVSRFGFPSGRRRDEGAHRR
jgi:hypothetical protein